MSQNVDKIFSKNNTKPYKNKKNAKKQDEQAQKNEEEVRKEVDEWANSDDEEQKPSQVNTKFNLVSKNKANTIKRKGDEVGEQGEFDWDNIKSQKKEGAAAPQPEKKQGPQEPRKQREPGAKDEGFNFGRGKPTFTSNKPRAKFNMNEFVEIGQEVPAAQEKSSAAKPAASEGSNRFDAFEESGVKFGGGRPMFKKSENAKPGRNEEMTKNRTYEIEERKVEPAPSSGIRPTFTNKKKNQGEMTSLQEFNQKEKERREKKAQTGDESDEGEKEEQKGREFNQGGEKKRPFKEHRERREPEEREEGGRKKFFNSENKGGAGRGRGRGADKGGEKKAQRKQS